MGEAIERYGDKRIMKAIPPRFTFLNATWQDGWIRPRAMSSAVVLEGLAGFLAATGALWFVARRGGAPLHFPRHVAQALLPALQAHVLSPGRLASVGLLALRLSVGVMMLHHGQEKLADPQQFASTYVASLHLPFPLVFAYAAGFSELIGSWLVILGLLTPLGALALTGTMAVAAYQHILTAGFNIYVLELVVLYLGGSLALLLVGPGRFSFDAGMVAELLAAGNTRDGDDGDALSGNGIQPAYVPVSATETSRFSRRSQ
ncbi:MAG: hypothetical protein RLZZ117_1694 [Cyanobacteriota bacterium]|jgi:putative oxidoreductase